MNEEVLKLWADLLNRDSSAHLYLRTFALDDLDLQQKIKKFFKGNGIEEERISLEGSDKRENFINNYNKLDVALDVFPYCGATTRA